MNIKDSYNPDILECLANLSSDEVFTPPDIANDMLDLLPKDLFTSKTSTFLDPACKSGVFLREIVKRLIRAQLPDYDRFASIIINKQQQCIVLDDAETKFLKELQATIDHILKYQVYGIAITEMTGLLSRRSLYCSKLANSNYSISQFDNNSGNIRFVQQRHSWEDGKCSFCGAPKSQYDREDNLESHAYEWIHTKSPYEIWGIDFDVIITNPPYQMSDGGAKASAKPIYQIFVDQCKKMNPRYLCMAIPSRWFAGGKGLDEFRRVMLKDHHISKMVDYTDSSECFPGVDIAGGICYFLRDREFAGDCDVTNIVKGKRYKSTRALDEFDTFVRYSEAAEIVKKIQVLNEPTMAGQVSSRKPFGLDTTIKPLDDGELLLR